MTKQINSRCSNIFPKYEHRGNVPMPDLGEKYHNEAGGSGAVILQMRVWHPVFSQSRMKLEGTNIGRNSELKSSNI
jgi:hypothetical protein